MMKLQRLNNRVKTMEEIYEEDDHRHSGLLEEDE